MNAKYKSALIITAKNAINALLVNTGLWWVDPATFNWSHAGLVHMAHAALAVIITREIMFWGPKLLRWSQSVDGGSPQP